MKRWASVYDKLSVSLREPLFLALFLSLSFTTTKKPEVSEKVTKRKVGFFHSGDPKEQSDDLLTANS